MIRRIVILLLLIMIATAAVLVLKPQTHKMLVFQKIIYKWNK